MKIRVLSEKKYNKYLKTEEYQKEQEVNVKSFVYDEDCFWFDYKEKRFGISIPQILKLREKILKELREDLPKD